MKSVHVKEKLALDGALEMSYQYRRVDMGESIKRMGERGLRRKVESEEMHMRQGRLSREWMRPSMGIPTVASIGATPAQQRTMLRETNAAEDALCRVSLY